MHIGQAVLNAAAMSHTPDAVAKMEWLLLAGAGSCFLQPTTAMVAARTGDLGRLRWLRDRGCPFETHALRMALKRAGLPVAQWLVGEGLVELPPPAGESIDYNSLWDNFLRDAAEGPDGVAKLRWLQEQGAPSLTGVGASLVRGMALLAVGAGRVEVVQYLLLAVGPAAVMQDSSDQETFGRAAARSGSTHMAQYLVQEAGLVLSHKAYNWAAEVCDLAMIRWLTLEAEVSATGCNLCSVVEQWPLCTQAHSRDLLEAVQLMVGAGCCGCDATDAMAAATRRGDLVLAQYLHRQQPEQLPVRQYQAATVSGGCEALLEWMAQQPGWLDNVDSPYCNAAFQGDKATLATLRRLGVPWGHQSLLVLAVSEWGCKVPVLRWLVEQGAPVVDRGELQQAVEEAVQRRGLG